MPALLQVIAAYAVIGAIGGVASYLSTMGFRRRVELTDGPSETNVFKTTAVGAFAAALTLMTDAAYGSCKVLQVAACTITPDGTTKVEVSLQSLTMQQAVTALGVGFLGAKWLNKWSQGEQLKWLGAMAANESPNPELGIALARGDTKAAKSRVAGRIGPRGDAGADPASDDANQVS